MQPHSREARTWAAVSPVSAAAQVGMTPANRIQIYGAYHGPDSPPETSPTRHHRSTPRRIHFPATQVLIGHANRVQPYPQTATGYPKTPSLLACESFLFPPPVRRGGPSLPRASVIDGQDLATVLLTACGRPKSISLLLLSPCAWWWWWCSHRLPVSSPVSLSAPA